jgi:hypothetical protein
VNATTGEELWPAEPRRWRGGKRRLPLAVAAVALTAMTFTLVAIACGPDSVESLDGPPVGEPLLPDLVAEPPETLQTVKDADGKWTMRFSSILVNVSDADFILEGKRSGDAWAVDQRIAYSKGGSEVAPTKATMLWGGDGHDHWHVERVATYHLERVDASGTPIAGAVGRPDAKVGFCFYDSHKKLDGGPEKAQFKKTGCGKETAVGFRMGLSPSWGDVYDFRLPGQSVSIDGLPDGRYRLWAEADPQAWFREVTRDNNITWIDLELTTREDSFRIATMVASGPRPA